MMLTDINKYFEQAYKEDHWSSISNNTYKILLLEGIPIDYYLKKYNIQNINH